MTLPTFAPTPWGEAVAALLLPSLDGDAAALDRLAARVDSGNAQLLGVFDGADMVAACVVATDGTEAVVKAAGGHWQGGGLVEMLLPVLEQGFKAAGMETCRVETFRRGMMEKISRQLYRPHHVSFVKVL